MAEYLIRNSLNPGKVVSCTITFRQLIVKGDEGEPVWVVEIGTMEPHKNGGEIPPAYIHYTSTTNLDASIKDATEKIADQVDWEPLSLDLRPPFVTYSEPDVDDTVVNIHSNVIVDIKDILPAAGIDPTSVEVTVNDIDVTGEIDLIGDPYRYRVKWVPSVRVLDTE